MKIASSPIRDWATAAARRHRRIRRLRPGPQAGRFPALFDTAKELFPGAIAEDRAELWAGLRPMLPNSVPVHGRARYANLYLDTGHGHVGWTMACGSGKFRRTSSPDESPISIRGAGVP